MCRCTCGLYILDYAKFLDYCKLKDEEFVSFMKMSLPSYVVQCFLYAGFDTPGVIAQMDRSDGPNNSLDVIESFILKNFPNESSCYYFSPSSSFIFSPGHRMRIADFVKEIRSKFVVDNVTMRGRQN